MNRTVGAVALALAIVPATAVGQEVATPALRDSLRSVAQPRSLPRPPGRPLSLDQEKRRLDRETHAAYLRYLFTRNREGADSPEARMAREKFEKLDRERRAILKRMGF